MSKKRLQNRLNHLFSSITHEVDSSPALRGDSTRPQGWTWEADEHGHYCSVSPEMGQILGIPVEEVLGKPFYRYLLDEEIFADFSTIPADALPVEFSVRFQDIQGNWHRAILSILSAPDDHQSTWKGTVVLLPKEEAKAVPAPKPPAVETKTRIPSPSRKPPSHLTPAQPFTPAFVAGGTIFGVAAENGKTHLVTAPSTPLAMESLRQKKPVVVPAQAGLPATIAVPENAGEYGKLLVEIIDNDPQRIWDDEEHQLVLEVASQLVLALENAHLYNAAQQELAERVRAEQEILHRNQDLATLNRIGQRLTSLRSHEEIYQTFAEMAKEVLSDRNLFIAVADEHYQTLTFPIYREEGVDILLAERPFGKGLPEALIQHARPVLFKDQVARQITRFNCELPERLPKSLLAIPILVNERPRGVLVIQDYEKENAPQFDEVHVELLSTAASQVSTALENATLFLQMQETLKALENRERYQAGVARSAATLSEAGTQALGDVLKYLGQAAQASRVYFLQFSEGVTSCWTLVEDWTSPIVAYLLDPSKIHTIPAELFANLVGFLRTEGWVIPTDFSSEDLAAQFFTSQGIQSALILGIQGKTTMPDLLIFEHVEAHRWSQDEINALRVAAEAIANTFVREDLLVQLRANLDETESLYKASNQLVVASNFQEMLSAVITGVRMTEINRGVMLLFEMDSHQRISRVSVQANWYSGRGTPPPQIGTEFPRVIYERPLQTNSQYYFENLEEAVFDEALKQDLLKQNVRSLAVLPMWAGKRQIGVVLLEGEQKRAFSPREKRLLPPLIDQLTIVVENLRLFEQTQQALKETARLYNISSEIAAAKDADEMVDLVIREALPRGAEAVSLHLTTGTEGEINEIEVAAYHSITGRTQFKGARLRASDVPILFALPDEGISFAQIDDGTLDPVSATTLKRFGIQSGVIVPLRSGGRTIGVMGAFSSQSMKYDPAEIRVFQTVANGIAVAIEKIRLLQQAERRALELQTAAEIARDTTSTLSTDVLLRRIVTLVVERFNLYQASIFLLDDTGTYAVVRESYGPAAEQLKERKHKLAVGSRSVVGTVTATGEPFILNDVTTSTMYYPNPLLPETRSEMALPLKLGNRVIGALDLQSRNLNAFRKDELAVLTILADQIAVAIENARAYELAQKAVEEMREVDRVKSQFLANMSHELRTPLNSIIGFSRVILRGIDGPINETQQQDLTAIYNSGQHLLNLINDILDLSKIEAGKMELSFSDVNIPDMINSAMSTAVGLVKDKPIKLITEIEEGLPTVRADATRVRQVLINFLSNAAKFTDEGSITVRARRVRSPEGKPEIMITVTDTGPGIAEEDRSKLFLPFSQVDDSPTRKTGGTGLGLSICRSLIEMHGGRIGLLESTVGVGSTFFFTLPLPLEEGKPEEYIPEDALTVLAVDDDPQVIELYQRFLKPQGYYIIPHTDPRTVVERVKEVQPFAITLDIMMPEVDGWQVMKKLKSDPETRDIPIVVCSILEEEEKGYSLGAADYLVKPFLSEDLLGALNRLNRDGKIREVLVIDDDPEDLRLVQKMLEESQRYHVNLAQGGKAGWDFLQNSVPDVIILDLFMPEMNGFELLGNLRTHPTFKSIPVIVLTGADLTAEQHQQLNEFGQSLLTKAMLREKELLNSLEEALRRFRNETKPS
ncbi:GAF domain-containing protein [Anaerolinea thermophila]|uniref:GAF domain-containing protein n=2 Tax=Anaerolinea TaxID=233189 RepID=UPI0026F00B52|nr:GAF domain-containing protein [Anaerolinea thermophila]